MPVKKNKARLPARENAPSSGRYVLQQQIGFALRLAFQYHTAIFTSRMVGELTQPQFAALWTLQAIGKCSQNSLGRLTALDSATIKGVIKRLAQRRLVSAAPDAADKRRLVLTVTDEGKALLHDAERAAADITEATLVNLTTAERRHLLALLAKTYMPTDGIRGRRIVARDRHEAEAIP